MKTELTVAQSRKLIKLGISPEKGVNVLRTNCNYKGRKEGDVFFTLDQCLELVPPCKGGLFTIIRKKNFWYVGDLRAEYFYRESFHAHELIDAIYKLLVGYYTNHKEE